MISVFLWLFLLFVVWIYLIWSRRKFYALMLKLSGPPGYPLIGMAHKLRRREEIIKIFHENEQKYGPLFLSWLGPVPFLVVSDPQTAQDILTSPYCVNKGFIYDAVEDGAGRGLFSLKNPEWSVHRKLLNPAFGHGVLLTFVPIFNGAVKELMKDLDALVGQGEIELTPVLQKFTMNVATLTTMGIDGNTDKVDNNSQSQQKNLLLSYQCLLENVTQMCFSPWLRYRLFHWLGGNYKPYAQAKHNIRSFIRQMISQKVEMSSRAQNVSVDTHKSRKSDNADIKKTNNNCFIDLAIDLLRKGKFTRKNIEDETNVVVFGAFETTANTLSYTLILLAMFPIYQQKAFEEIYTIFPQRDDFEVTYEDVQQMVYMDMVLNESMRIMASVPLIARQSSHDVILSNGVLLPAGLQIAIDIFNMHRREDIWGAKAAVFNPDNFLPSNMEGKHPYAFIPFTKGIRNCIGWRYALISMKITLARILRKYRVTTSFSFLDLQFLEDITLKLKKTPFLEFHPRSSA